MRQVVVRYKVKDGRASENEALVRSVFDELHRAAPGGVRYRTLKLEDGLSFIHIFESETGSGPLSDLPAFKAFVAEARARCDEPPQSMTFTEVGTYDAAP
ncbi:MAG: hypothetical protein JF588_04400 [Caulobacterales bacterium]|nr:hypothetical protein [Caulobacterales bacterium]